MRSNRFAFAWCLVGLASVLPAGCSKTGHADPAPTEAGVLAYRSEQKAGGGATSTDAGGTGWGTLKGTFTIAGAAPAPLKPLSTGGKDGAVCDTHAIPDERLVVDSATKGIKNIVIYAVEVRRIHPDLEAQKTKEVVFDQKNCVFLSHVLPVWLPQTMVIKNSDPISHNTNFGAAGEPGFNDMLKQAAAFPFKFSRSQDKPITCICNVHPWMKCYVLPRKNPYFAVTNEKGEFTIENLPAGEEIQFQVWHEASEGLAAKPEWSKGRFKLKIPENGTTPVDAQVDASLFKL
jgi:hypothetical protein